MAWGKLNYSKKQVRRAGEYLITDWDDTFNIDKYLDAYEVLTNWRASHAYPMSSMIGYFRKKALSVDEKAIIAQRLKRLPSIIHKLGRENGMKLDRIEDIAGCRIVVNNLRGVYEVRDKIVEGRTRNNLRRERNYIKTPKESGYRSIHLIYAYNGAKPEFKGQCVELQIRSQIQHAWATAVEVVGTFTGQALKASRGHDAWLRFFQLSSIAFTDIESKRLVSRAKSNEREELFKYINRLDVLKKLRAFAVSIRHVEKDNKNKGHYFLMMLDTSESKISFRRYTLYQLDQASGDYAEFEQKYKDDKTKDVVLVAASSIHGLKKAYPNYFADTGEFSKHLIRLIETNKKIKADEERRLKYDR